MDLTHTCILFETFTIIEVEDRIGNSLITCSVFCQTARKIKRPDHA